MHRKYKIVTVFRALSSLVLYVRHYTVVGRDVLLYRVPIVCRGNLLRIILQGLFPNSDIII